MEEKHIIETIKKVMPCVVSIVSSRHLADVEKDMHAKMYPLVSKKKRHGASETQSGEENSDDDNETVPDGWVDKDGMVEVGGSSGFIVDSSGLILTNKHVINEPDAQHTVITNDGKKYIAQILSRDPMNDVAILKIQAENLPALTLGDASKLELGATVIAIGNALGIFKNTVSVGIVSGLSRAISAQGDEDAPPQEMRGLIQTDAAINPGNSGGPLVDSKGVVIGINAAVVFGAQSIGFAIPIQAAKRDLADVKKYGHIRRPFLGIRYIVIDENLQAKMNLAVDYGAVIMREGPQDSGVTPGSSADKAGLQENDIILECNGQRVDRDHPIQDILEDLVVGDTLNVVVLRGSEKLDVQVLLAERTL